MKKLKVGKTFTLVDDEDYEWLNLFSWKYDEKSRYVHASIKLSRLIMKLPKNLQVDHIDGDKLNNQKSNLRLCTNGQNQMNKPRGKRSRHGYKGIRFIARYKINPWIAVIQADNKRRYLGSFPTKEDAAVAWNKAAFKYHGEFASLNIILPAASPRAL